MKKFLLSSVLVAALASSSLMAKSYATVNGDSITQNDISVILRDPRVKYDTLKPDVQKQVLNQAIERKLLAKNAYKSGVVGSSEYKEALGKLKKDLALQLWMKKELNNIKVSDKNAKIFYKENMDKFKQPESVKAKHILLKTKNEAIAVIKELDSGAKFVELAKSKSTGPSGKNGGDLGWFSKKKMVPEFSEAAFKLAKGTYTKTPVKTNFGYHVILVEDKKSKSTVAFDKVKDRLKYDLKTVKFRDKIKNLASSLKSKAKIVYK